MGHRATPVKEKVAAHGAKQIAAGRVVLNTYVPSELIEAIDKIKEQRGAPLRMPVTEEALSFISSSNRGHKKQNPDPVTRTGFYMDSI